MTYSLESGKRRLIQQFSLIRY